jgi:peptidoglycan/LPS O-acetylase OafA/YrhL
MGPKTLLALCLATPVLLLASNHWQSLGLHAVVINNVNLSLLRAGLWGGFATCLVGVVVQLDLKHRLNWPAILLRLGDASYSIYLIAPVVMSLLSIFLATIGHVGGLSPIISGFLYISGTIIGGLLCWRYIEVPITNKARTFLKPVKSLPVAIVSQAA